MFLSFWHETLHFGKFEGVDFKYDKFFFKLQPKNTQIWFFWS